MFEREKIDFVRFFQKYFFILFWATFRGETNAFCFFLSPLPLTFSFCAVKLFRNAAVSFSIICACVHSGKKRPHSLATSCSLPAHTLTIPCERPQGDCPAVHSHIHCALGGNRLAWQPNKSLFSMILWDSCEFSLFFIFIKPQFSHKK